MVVINQNINILSKYNYSKWPQKITIEQTSSGKSTTVVYWINNCHNDAIERERGGDREGEGGEKANVVRRLLGGKMVFGANKLVPIIINTTHSHME